MPLATHLPEADAGGVTATAKPVTGSRLGGASRGIAALPSADLLPSGGPPARDPAPAPARALALDALRLLRAWYAPERRPAHWSDPRFQAAVESVRRQLWPIPSRRALASSFGREAFHVIVLVPTGALDADATRLGYALRWLELGRGADASPIGVIPPPHED